MRLSLKAQSQCRSTLEALAEIKNPKPVAFVQQANIAHGPQQVNNGTAPPPADPSRAGESEKPPNKLLESQNGERLDTGAAGAAGGADSRLEAVGTGNRSTDGARQGGNEPQRLQRESPQHPSRVASATAATG
jgi:hypothetical protein